MFVGGGRGLSIVGVGGYPLPGGENEPYSAE